MTAMSGTRSAQRSWELAARAGYVVSGLLHVVIGVLALRIAFGSGNQQADQSGAHGRDRRDPVRDRRPVVHRAGVRRPRRLAAGERHRQGVPGAIERDGQRLRAREGGGPRRGVPRAGVHGAEVRPRGSRQQLGAGPGLDGHPDGSAGGRFLVAAVGIAVVVVGGYHVYKGATKKFLEDLRGLPPAPAEQPFAGSGSSAMWARGSRWRSSGCSSSSPPSPRTPRGPPGWTVRCTRCVPSRPGSCSSSWSPRSHRVRLVLLRAGEVRADLGPCTQSPLRRTGEIRHVSGTLPGSVASARRPFCQVRARGRDAA